MVKMPYKFKRDCPVCGKPKLILSLSYHLRQVHRLTSHERKQWLKAAVFSESKGNLGITQGVSIAAVKETKKPQHCKVKRPKLSNNVFLESKPYPEFMCRHKSSLLVVGPSQCGKTWGLKKIPLPIVFFTRARNRGEYIWRYYSQWQDSYKVIQSSIGKEIQFIRGLPEFKEDLREVDPKFNNVLVFDDLMAQATDSSLFSLLFTQGRTHV